MFLHPWAVALGAAAIVLPVVVHLLTRPRPTPLPLSTVRFVREAVRQRRARSRLRDIVILSLRTLAVLLVALGVARPRLDERPVVSDAVDGSAVRVVLLDVSQSMAAAERGVEAMERARAAAGEHLGYRPGLKANLILAAAQPHEAFSAPSANLEALRNELARAVVRPERLDVNRALARAAEMLAPQSPDDKRRRELVIVSDFQRTNWARADLSPLPPETRVQFESVASATTPANLSIAAVRTQGRASPGEAGRLEVEVANDSPAARQVAVEVTLGEAAYRVEGACPPGRRTTLAAPIRLPRAGWLWGEAQLVGADDALAADDALGVTLEARATPTYALVTRESPGELSSSYFLECALAPEAGGDASAQVVRLDPQDLDRDALAVAELFVIDHPGKLPDATTQALAGALLRGRPILYVAAESIDATNLRLLSDAAGGLAAPVEFAPPQGRVRRNLFVTSFRREAPPFRVFGDDAAAVIGKLQFAGGLDSRRVEGALADEVLAEYSDGTACLTVSLSDRAALAVLNADLGASNLPTTGAFVPLLHELVRSLLQDRGAAAQAVGGESLVVRLPAAISTAAELRIAGPGPDVASSEPAGALVEEGAGVVWRWPAPASPGVYRVERGGETVFALSVRIPPEESQLESLPEDVLKERLAAGRRVHYRSTREPAGQRDSLWTWLLTACVVCLLAEITALLTFRS